MKLYESSELDHKSTVLVEDTAVLEEEMAALVEVAVFEDEAALEDATLEDKTTSGRLKWTEKRKWQHPA